MKWEYLLFNCLVFFSSTISISVYKKAVRPDLRAAAIAISLMAVVFLVWDELVKGWFWSFNPAYVLGLQIGRLPFEEVLFFFTVPWSSLILWLNFRDRIHGTITMPSVVSWGVSFLFFLLSAQPVTQGWWYTFVVCALSMLAVFFMRLKKTVLRADAAFFGLLTGLMMVFNGYLTSRPVVLYNPETFAGVRLGSVPLEDFLYGYLLLYGVAQLYLLATSTRVAGNTPVPNLHTREQKK